MCGGKEGEKGKNAEETERQLKNRHQPVSGCTPFSVRMGLGPSSTMTPSLLGGTRFKKLLKKRPVAPVLQNCQKNIRFRQHSMKEIREPHSRIHFLKYHHALESITIWALLKVSTLCTPLEYMSSLFSASKTVSSSGLVSFLKTKNN